MTQGPADGHPSSSSLRALKGRRRGADVGTMVLTIVLVVVAVAWSGLALLVTALCAMAARGDRELLAAVRVDGSADDLPAPRRRAITAA